MSRRGFSLVELSIVLVILGLLTGGILAGQSLIRAAELRSINTEFQRYQAAAHTFRDKYFALPGDMTNATAFWGKDAAACNGQTGTAATPGTCNSNGDGKVNAATAGGATSEIFQFWKQLALAGLVEGSYTGLSGSAGMYAIEHGTNAPRARLSNAGWHASTNDNYPGDADTYNIDLGNHFFIGRSPDALGPALKPEEAWNLDVKMDDGKPAQGKVIAKYWNNLCAAADDGSSANNDLVASYRLSDSTLRCGVYFVRSF